MHQKLITLMLMAVVVGCGGLHEGADSAQLAVSQPKKLGILIEAMPSNAKGVIETRADAKDGETVVITGRIGGQTDPWVSGRAAFQIVDTSLIPCNEREHGGCPTPWDYCCLRHKLPTATATIKFVDAEGNTISTDAREYLGVKELLRITIEGQAKRDEAGNLTVLARGIHINH